MTDLGFYPSTAHLFEQDFDLEATCPGCGDIVSAHITLNCGVDTPVRSLACEECGQDMGTLEVWHGPKFQIRWMVPRDVAPIDGDFSNVVRRGVSCSE